MCRQAHLWLPLVPPQNRPASAGLAGQDCQEAEEEQCGSGHCIFWLRGELGLDLINARCS